MIATAISIFPGSEHNQESLNNEKWIFLREQSLLYAEQASLVIFVPSPSVASRSPDENQ